MILLEKYEQDFQEKMQKKLYVNYFYSKLVKNYNKFESVEAVSHYVNDMMNKKVLDFSVANISLRNLRKMCDYFLDLNKKNEELKKIGIEKYDIDDLMFSEMKIVEQNVKKSIKMLRQCVETEISDSNSSTFEIAYAERCVNEMQNLLYFLTKKDKSKSQTDCVYK